MRLFIRSFRLLALFAALTLSIIFVTACGSSAARFTIEGRDDHTFVPNTVTVNSGQSVELTLVNNGKLDHTFTINDPNLNIEVIMRAGETSSIKFTAPQRGEYIFSSGVLSELDAMKGTLIVK